MKHRHRTLLFSHRDSLVLCSLTFPCADGSIPVLALRPVWELEKPRGYPSVILALATATLVIMLLFYQDGNSSTTSFRERPSRKNIPITSSCSQRVVALNFVKKKKTHQICQTEKILSANLGIYNRLGNGGLERVAKFVIACMLGSGWYLKAERMEGRVGRINLWLCLNTTRL